MRDHKFFHTKENKILGGICVILFLIASYFIYSFIILKNNLSLLNQDREALKNDLEKLSLQYSETLNLLETNKKDKDAVVESLNQIGLDYNNLMQKYTSTSDENLKLLRTVQLDDELLKKYSKYYFLNENYQPANLSDVDSEFVEKGKVVKVLPEVKFRLEQMLREAKATSTVIVVNSGYRSFLEQKGLKTAYAEKYGVGTANQFSADQGYSEHQLGTTVDLTDGKRGLDQRFDKTKTFKWLTENAYQYGFIMSYPKNNKFYIYEPWHWRFVGLELAKYLHDNNLNFYDLDQKFIDTFKVKIFN